MKTATTTALEEEFGSAESAKFKRWLDHEKQKEIAAERFKAGSITEKLLLRNSTGNPRSLPFGCTFDVHELAKEIRCDGSDPVCRLRASKPVAAPGELFWVPPGHRRGVLNPALPEVDPASVADEPTLQDRLLLGELRSFEQRAEAPANLAARTLADLEAQERILAERKLQQQAEVDRRQSHVQAAKSKTEEFLGSRSEAWRKAILGGAPEAALETATRATAEADRRSAEIHTLDDLKRAQAGETGATAFKMGANGPEPLHMSRASR